MSPYSFFSLSRSIWNCVNEMLWGNQEQKENLIPFYCDCLAWWWTTLTLKWNADFFFSLSAHVSFLRCILKCQLLVCTCIYWVICRKIVNFMNSSALIEYSDFTSNWIFVDISLDVWHFSGGYLLGIHSGFVSFFFLWNCFWFCGGC